MCWKMGKKIRVNGWIFHWDLIGSSAVSCRGRAVGLVQ